MTPESVDSRAASNRTMSLFSAFASSAWKANCSSARRRNWNSIWNRSPKPPKTGVRVIVLRLKRVRNPDAVCMSVLDRFIERMQHGRRDACCCAACGPI